MPQSTVFQLCPGRIVLSFISTQQRIKCLAQGHDAAHDPQPFNPEPSTLQLSQNVHMNACPLAGLGMAKVGRQEERKTKSSQTSMRQAGQSGRQPDREPDCKNNEDVDSQGNEGMQA